MNENETKRSRGSAVAGEASDGRIRPVGSESGRSPPSTAGKDLATRPSLFAADRKLSLAATRGKPAAASSQATGTAAQPHAAEEPLSVRKTSGQEPAPATSATTTRPQAAGKAGARRREPDAVKDRRPAAKRSSSRKAKARATAGAVSKKDTPWSNPGHRTQPARKAKASVSTAVPKKEAVLGLLRRERGATLKELMNATGWQSHSVRGFLSGVVRKKLGLKVKSAKRESGERVYSVRV